MSTFPAPLNAGDLILISPDPLLRRIAWNNFYTETKSKILGRIQKVATWLDRDDAKSILNDAYLKADECLAAEPHLLSKYRAEVIVVLKAELITTNYLRHKLTLKRGSKIDLQSLEASSPSLSDVLAMEDRPADPWLEAELRRQVDGLKPRFQRLIGHAILSTPGIKAGEIAEMIAGQLGKEPSVGSVVTARKELRRKLGPFGRKIRNELAK